MNWRRSACRTARARMSRWERRRRRSFRIVSWRAWRAAEREIRGGEHRRRAARVSANTGADEDEDEDTIDVFDEKSKRWSR